MAFKILPLNIVAAFNQFAMIAHTNAGVEVSFDTLMDCAKEFAPIFGLDACNLFDNWTLYDTLVGLGLDAESIERTMLAVGDPVDPAEIKNAVLAYNYIDVEIDLNTVH